MRIIVKIPFLLYIIILLSTRESLPYEEALVLILIIGAYIFRERFFDAVAGAWISLVLVCIGIYLDRDFAVLLALCLFDFVYKKFYIGILPVLGAAVYFVDIGKLQGLLLLVAVCGILAYILKKSRDREEKQKANLDNERRLRYELEQARSKLLTSARETVRLTEVSERNRIARDIHDNVGHKIAGILMQLQAASKLYSIDEGKTKEILNKSIDGLSETVTLLRDTVHNLKPRENLGVEYIQAVIKDFGFCPIDFTFTGDLSLLPPTHIGIINSNIKEALTNASKYSGATRIIISLDMNEKYVRLYIKDNGVGCERIKEGLGLSGMKERVDNLGGSISISAEDGFLIVCMLPIQA